jgi:hypothetical protein
LINYRYIAVYKILKVITLVLEIYGLIVLEIYGLIVLEIYGLI